VGYEARAEARVWSGWSSAPRARLRISPRKAEYYAVISVGVTGPLSAGDGFPVPRSIRGVLLPEEAGDFDREFRAAMAQATETLDLTGVVQLLERWRRVAESSRDAPTHRRMLEHADQLSREDTADEVSTEAWPATRNRLGL
jgi:hypothetical protein